MKHYDIIIIGDGIVARSIAFILAQFFRESHRSPTILMLARDQFHTASNSNHGWLHYGSFYLRHEPEVARLLAQQAPILRTWDGSSYFGNPGIFYVDDEALANAIVRHNEPFERSLGFSSRVLSRDETIAFLGEDYYLDVGFFLTVADHPFREGSVLNYFDEKARSLGVEKIWSKTPATIQPTVDGLDVNFNGSKFSAERIFVAAGAGTYHVCKNVELKCPPQLKASYSTLVRVQSEVVKMRVPLYANLSTGLSIVRHSHPDLGDYCVFGNSFRSGDYNMSSEASPVKLADEAAIWSLVDCVSEAHKNHIRIAKSNDISSCLKVEQLDSEGKPHHGPWIYVPSEFPGLVIGGPGKATSGYFTAAEMVKLSNIDLASDNECLSPPGPPTDGPKGESSQWYFRS